MPRAIYIVILSGGNWWIDLEGTAYGPFTSREAAKQEAIVLANHAAPTGRPSEVRVPDETSRYAIAWETEPYRFASSPFALGKSASETPVSANQP